MTQSGPPRGRIDRLDGLRGIAALAVVIFHYTAIFPEFFENAVPPAFRFFAGAYGVHLFFIISGFVILMTLEKRGGGQDFIVHRLIRLYPVFWACVLLSFLVQQSDFPGAPTPGMASLFVSLTMLQDFVKIPPVDGVYWSLTYELSFYAIMVLVFRTRLQRHIEWIAGGWIAGTLLFPLLGPFIPHPLHFLLMINAWGHLFAAGLVLYLVWRSGWTRWRAGLLTAAVLAQYPQPFTNFQDRGVEGVIVVSLLVALVALVASTSRLQILASGPLRFIGRISYPLYLVHQMAGYVLLAALQKAGAGWWLSVSITLCAAIGISSLVTVFFDEPVRRFLLSRARKYRLAR